MQVDPSTMTKTETNKLATCRDCGTSRRIRVLTRQWFNKPNGLGLGVDACRPTLALERVKINDLHDSNLSAKALLKCCGKSLDFDAIKGKTTNHVCGDKCLSATGPACSCSCGGKNHGHNHQ